MKNVTSQKQARCAALKCSCSVFNQEIKCIDCDLYVCKHHDCPMDDGEFGWSYDLTRTVSYHFPDGYVVRREEKVCDMIGEFEEHRNV